jgi:hypothetical protein
LKGLWEYVADQHGTPPILRWCLGTIPLPMLHFINVPSCASTFERDRVTRIG